MPTRRQERVAKRIVQELVDAVRDLKNVTLGFITFTGCEVSPDLRHAKVLVSVFGTDEERDGTLSALRQNAGRLKGMIGRPLGTKVTPDLHFEFDASLEAADRMSRLIRDARSTDPDPSPLTPDEAAGLRAAAAAAAASAAERDADTANPFDRARAAVEEELFAGGAAGAGDTGDGFDGSDDDSDADISDPSWKAIDLDKLPDDDEEGTGDSDSEK